MIIEFIDHQRARGRRLEVVCRVLTEQGCRISARTYRAWKHHQPSDREKSDQPILDKLQSLTVTEEGKRKRQPESLYGRRKMTRWLRRQGFVVSFRRTDRLMRRLGMNGVLRGKKVRTTVPDPHASRPPDLVDRVFTAEAPNLRWVADFTYVRTWSGWVYVAFITDCYSRRIVGWHAATHMTTSLVETALRMAIWQRDRDNHPIGTGLIHHSDAGSQYTAIHFGETLWLAGIRPSIGSVGDAYDNALAESVNGIYKTECVAPDSPFQTGPLTSLEDVEWITMAWVDWYNHDRLHSTLNYLTPAEHENAYYNDHIPIPLG